MSAAAGAQRVKVILGTMEMGRRACDQTMSNQMVQAFLKAGHTEVDTALMYCGGKTEKILGNMSKDVRGKMKIATKANPWGENKFSSSSLPKQLHESLSSLKAEQVDIFYLHAPDHTVPIEETLSAVDKLHKEGKFLRFGLSNYSSWQVADIYRLCEAKGYVLPSVYQGMYNALTRSVEQELLPCLRRFNIAFYVYNPLAGGLLTGRYKYDDLKSAPEGRFSEGGAWAKTYQDRFWHKSKFEGIEKVNAALVAAYGEGEDKVQLAEASLRWLLHHSTLDGRFGDGLIIGASSMTHLPTNLATVDKGPLDDRVVKAFQEAWEGTKADCPLYFR